MRNILEEHNFFYRYYFIPYCRYMPYVLGVYSGFVYLRYLKSHSEEIDSHRDGVADFIIKYLKYSKFGPIISFIVGVSVILIILIVQKPLYAAFPFDSDWTPTQEHIFIAFHKILFSFGLMMILFPILFSRLSILYKLMSAKFWIFLGKISYCTYIMHYGVLVFFDCTQTGN